MAPEFSVSGAFCGEQKLGGDGPALPRPADPSTSKSHKTKGKGPQRSPPTWRAVPNIPANKSRNGLGGKELVPFHPSLGRDTFPVQGAPSPVQRVLEHSQGWSKEGTPWGGGIVGMTCYKSQCGLMNPFPLVQDLDVSTLHRTELEVKLKGLQELLELKKTIYEQVGTLLERAGTLWGGILGTDPGFPPTWELGQGVTAIPWLKQGLRS